MSTAAPQELKVSRLNYIGSKYKLLDWLESGILQATGWSSLADHTVADLFAGTGIVTAFLRMKGARTISNDAELYSATITAAFARSSCSPDLLAAIADLNAQLAAGAAASTCGHLCRSYAPIPPCERTYFTADNARRIDYTRRWIEERPAAEREFLLASLLSSADAVANVASTYGCYLKGFKATAQRAFELRPVHQISVPGHPDAAVTCADVLAPPEGAGAWTAEAVYLDPPYNGRQYSKNYFPLNVLLLAPDAPPPALSGKTGIPAGCFSSAFCSKRGVAGAFEQLLRRISARWVFLSYSNEGLLSREDLTRLLGRFGRVTVLEREHKRFKSYEYNNGSKTMEYLFCLEKHPVGAAAAPAPEN